MRKLAHQLGADIQSEPRKRRWPLVLMILFLLIGLAPLAMEGAALCLGKWKEFMGASTNVPTPVLDQVSDSLHDMHTAFWLCITPFFRGLPWDPMIVLPAATIIMALAMFMLRR
jgi:hypothetical protein